jgi:hydrogenase maturation protein HypF
VEAEFADLLARWPAQRRQMILQLLRKRLQSPLTSSCGRLFDAMAALAGIRDVNVYEGQAAIEWEQILEEDPHAYSGSIWRADGIWIMDPLPMFAQAIPDIRSGMRPGLVSARFHNGLVALLADTVRQVAEITGLRRIALSGGVFQNAYLSSHLESRLRELDFEVYSHQELPPNDACIALGQAFVAGHWWQGRQGNDL